MSSEPQVPEPTTERAAGKLVPRIGAGGARPTFGQAAGREAFTLLGAIPYIGPVLALAAWIVIAVTINASPTGQGTHDRIGGGTQVVA
jgi:hypothetical protein